MKIIIAEVIGCLILAIILAGCSTQVPSVPAKTTIAPPLSSNQIPYVTPTLPIIYVTVTTTIQTSTIVDSQEPIIGSWRFYEPGRTDNKGSDTLQFSADGTVVEIFVPEGPGLTGTWSAVSGDNYRVNWSGTNYEIFVYDPVRNGIYHSTEPSKLYSPYPSDASSSQSSFGLPHFSGNGDDVRTFTATGSGLRTFSMTYAGQHNFIVKLTDSEGGYIDTLINTMGPYSGKKTATLNTGEYVLDITASGPWTIDISSI
jgi:hypothetical protein